MAAPKFNNIQNTNTQQDISTIKSQKIVAKRKRSPSVPVNNTKKDPKDPWKKFSRLKESAGIPVDLLIEDYQMIETTSRMVFPVVHKQSVGSNQCGPRVCCFMAEILPRKTGSPENIVFCQNDEQRLAVCSFRSCSWVAARFVGL